LNAGFHIPHLSESGSTSAPSLQCNEYVNVKGFISSKMPIHEGADKDLPPEVLAAIRLLVVSNHILHEHNLVDAFGHISVRHPSNPLHYIIAAYDPGAPALISSRKDFVEYHVGTSEPVYPPQPKGYSERYIHGEIFKRYPDVQCVIHSHAPAVIPFTAAGKKVKPVFHMAGFLGEQGPPVWDIGELYLNQEMETNPSERDMLVKNPTLGASLAETFCRSIQSSKVDFPVVLQHKHGFTCVGRSVQEAIYRAVYTAENCVLLKDALDLAGGDAEVAFLTKEEAAGCARMIELTMDKAFRLWMREVKEIAVKHGNMYKFVSKVTMCVSVNLLRSIRDLTF
jgi:ribulose-5-phosphate 4-epimerase/fuculose-1-phosphate aldolase